MPKRTKKRELGDYGAELQRYMLPIGECLELIEAHESLLKTLSFAEVYLSQLSGAENQLLEWVRYIDQCQDGAEAWTKQLLVEEFENSHESLDEYIGSETWAKIPDEPSKGAQAISEAEVTTMLSRLHATVRHKAMHLCDVLMSAA